jgi:hypothetical protein
MGPSGSDIEAGQVAVGLDYAYNELTIEVDGAGLNYTADLEAHVLFAKLALGLADGAELFGRLGVSDIDEDADNGFSSSDFAWGAGGRVTIAEHKGLKWGALAQLTWLTGDDNWRIGPYGGDSEFTAYEVQVTTGPSFEVGPVVVYGGPFLHFLSGDWDVRSGGVTVSFDVEQESEVGGYAGAAWNISELSSLAVEYQFTGDADAIGIGLVHRFGRPPAPQEPVKVRTPEVDASGRKIKGYQATTDPKTGRIVTRPVYEDEKK